MRRCLLFDSEKKANDAWNQIHSKMEPGIEPLKPVQLPDSESWAIGCPDGLYIYLENDMKRYLREIQPEWQNVFTRIRFPFLTDEDVHYIKEIKKAKISKIQESLLILNQLGEDLDEIWLLVDPDSTQERLNTNSFLLMGYIIIKLCSFNDEWEYMMKSNSEDERLVRLTKEILPIQNKIMHWHGLKKARNYLFAHQQRDGNKNYVDHESIFSFYVPTTAYEYYLLIRCVRHLLDFLNKDFTSELELALSYEHFRFSKQVKRGVSSKKEAEVELESILNLLIKRADKL